MGDPRISESQTKRTRSRWLIPLACVCLLVLAGAGYILFRYVETKTMACECDDPVDGMRFNLYVPFHGGASKSAALEVLNKLQQGRCAEIPEDTQHCAEEQTFRIVRWKLTGRDDQKDWASFRFTVWRVNRTDTNVNDKTDGFSDPIGISVRRENSTWKLDSISMYF